MNSGTNSSSSPPRVLIVGGGISGLTAAYCLSRAGVRSILVERRHELGGILRTARIGDVTIEEGADSYIATKPWAYELIQELGLADQVIGSNDERRRTYIVKRGRLVPLPDGLQLFAPTEFWPTLTTPLLGIGTKLRMGLEYFRRPSIRPERSVAQFVREHFGQETVDYLAEPLLAGVYGGDPEQLSASSVTPQFVEWERKFGSVIRGALHKRRQRSVEGPLFRTLKGGWSQLIDALEEAIRPFVEFRQGEALFLERRGGQYHLRVGDEWLTGQDVVLAGPSYEAARLLKTVFPPLAAVLAAIPYSSGMTVALEYDRQTLGHPLNGFGFLVPRRERRHVLACTWVGSKWKHRVPPDKEVLRCFLGSVQDESILREGDGIVTALARDELRRLMGIHAEPTFALVSRWPRSLAQYTVGHAERLEEIRQLQTELPGLWLAGNAYGGIGIPDCVRTAREVAANLLAQARAQHA